MSKQITLFPNQDEVKLEVVRMKFLENDFVTVEELFQGYNHLCAITFSYGLDFIAEIIDYFDTAEIIIGCDAVIKYDLKTIMAFQTHVIDEISARNIFKERIDEETLTFWVAKEIVSHEKIFILFDDDGNSRVIVGSANFSGRAFSGNTREYIGVFDNDTAALSYFMKEFEFIKQNSTNEITVDALYFTGDTTLEDTINSLPIIKEVKFNKAGIILEESRAKLEEIEYAVDISRISQKYSSLVPNMDTKDGKILVTPRIIDKIVASARKFEKDEREKKLKSPQFMIDYDKGTFTYNDNPYELEASMEQVKNDLINIGIYFEGFNDFIGESRQIKKAYFRVFNYMLLSPFVAKLRFEAYRNDFSTTLFPVYAIINGPKSAGKSAFVETVQKIMFGEPLNSLSPNVFTPSGIYGLLHESTGVPYHIEDIVRERFNKYCGQVVKFDNDLIKDRLMNHPVYIMTSNDIETIKPEFAKRVYYTSVDAQLTNVSAASKHKKMAEMRKQISTAFYKEYLRKMFPKVINLIIEMNKFEISEENEGWQPDIFELSSQTLLEIYNDCGLQSPEYVVEVKYSDYFGFNLLSEKIRDKILFEWKHNKKAFKAYRKQNVLEYNAGEKSYEADRICDVLPEALRAKRSGTKVVLNLEEAEAFFGIRFKGGFFS